MEIKEKFKGTFTLFQFGLFSFFLLLLASINIFLGINRQPEVLGVSSGLSEEKVYWENVVSKNPTYQDGWIELAKVEYYEGNISKAKEFLEKAKLIDPNSPKILESEIILLSRK